MFITLFIIISSSNSVTWFSIINKFKQIRGAGAGEVLGGARGILPQTPRGTASGMYMYMYVHISLSLYIYIYTCDDNNNNDI